ncbi:hypothetical protein NG01_04385 [Corynebacterium diphtheriae]|nr:hypothetical protein NG01_04385 [Corynebacterium diphtheriae]
MRLVKLKKSNDRLGIQQGEVYFAPTYFYDHGKVVLFRRYPDGYDPECTEYKENIEHVEITPAMKEFFAQAATDWRNLK